MKTVYDPVPESNKVAFKLRNHLCWSTIVTLVDIKFEISLFNEVYLHFYTSTKLNEDLKNSCLDSLPCYAGLSLSLMNGGRLIEAKRQKRQKRQDFWDFAKK